MKIFAAAFLTLACAYGALLLFARLFAERIIFPAPPASYSDGGDIIYLGLPGGGRAAALWIPAKDSKICAIYSHGNGEDLGEIRPLLEEYARRGISVFAYDYPGYGLSSGKPSIKGLEDSAEAAYRHVSGKLGFGDSDIAVVGYSLGGAAACEIASRHPGIRCAVVIGGFSKAVKAVLPVNIIPWEMLDNSSKISQFKFPALFMHGRRDMVVPFRNALENYKAAPRGLGRLAVFPDRGHYGLPDSPKYWDEAVGFILSGGRPNRNDKL